METTARSLLTDPYFAHPLSPPPHPCQHWEGQKPLSSIQRGKEMENGGDGPAACPVRVEESSCEATSDDLIIIIPHIHHWMETVWVTKVCYLGVSQ